jgi:hypothetical protein
MSFVGKKGANKRKIKKRVLQVGKLFFSLLFFHYPFSFTLQR